MWILPYGAGLPRRPRLERYAGRFPGSRKFYRPRLLIYGAYNDAAFWPFTVTGSRRHFTCFPLTTQIRSVWTQIRSICVVHLHIQIENGRMDTCASTASSLRPPSKTGGAWSVDRRSACSLRFISLRVWAFRSSGRTSRYFPAGRRSGSPRGRCSAWVFRSSGRTSRHCLPVRRSGRPRGLRDPLPVQARVRAAVLLQALLAVLWPLRPAVLPWRTAAKRSYRRSYWPCSCRQRPSSDPRSRSSRHPALPVPVQR